MAELAVGADLGPCDLTVDAAVVGRYADAADDHNPIHLDDDVARRLGLPQAVAHGMITGALLNRLVAGAVGADWLSRGRLQLKFVGPVPVGATVRATGRVTSTEPLTIDLRAETSGGVVVVGIATLEPVSAT